MTQISPNPDGVNRPVAVRFPALSEMSYTYKIAEAAIESTLRSERNARATTDNPLVRGSVIEDFGWFDRELRIRLSNARVLRVYLRDAFTEWQVQEAGAPMPPAHGLPRDLLEPPELHESVGMEGKYRTVWDGGSLLRNRLGTPLRSISPSNVWLHLYFEGRKQLTVCAMERVDDGSLFLQWFEDD